MKFQALHTSSPKELGITFYCVPGRYWQFSIDLWDWKLSVSHTVDCAGEYK